MLSAIKNAWSIPDLRKKITFTLWMLLIFRIGSYIPVPGIASDILAERMSASSLFDFMNILSGGSFKQLTIFAMGVIPYINASIILQLLTMVVPYFEKLAKEGQEGRRKMSQWTRYGAIVLGFCQALIMSFYLRPAMVNGGNLWFVFVCAVTMTAGTAFLMWLGEQITQKGLGNGISLIIFTGIVSRLPAGIGTIYQYVTVGGVSIIVALLVAIVAVFLVAGVVAVQQGQRRIPVQYAKRVVGRKTYGGHSTYIPMRINQAGVIPIIFAMSLLNFPVMIAEFFPANKFANWIVNVLNYQSVWYVLLYAFLIFVFSYFYTAATFDTNNVSENLKNNGGFIPGLRPGRPTAEYLDKILTRLTFAGAVFLTVIALMPSAFMAITKMNLYFGGTSLLIAVGVAIDTMKQIESQLIAHNYEGFLK